MDTAELDGRFIPACAGSRLEVTHERTEDTGSSPRARGAVSGKGIIKRIIRFIPACAGSSFKYRRSDSWRPVHPRVRGEQGKEIARHGDSSRFIPACAGSRTRPRWCAMRRSVHPRVRGEQLDITNRIPSNIGSSPRARGAVLVREAHVVAERFIPACAGSRHAAAVPGRMGPVHPRVRGEQCTSVISASALSGSSPRARGAVYLL